jgi:hypothetical protein
MRTLMSITGSSFANDSIRLATLPSKGFGIDALALGDSPIRSLVLVAIFRTFNPILS